MNTSIFVFIFSMWALMLAGGGLLILFIGPLSLVADTDVDPILNSIIK